VKDIRLSQGRRHVLNRSEIFREFTEPTLLGFGDSVKKLGTSRLGSAAATKRTIVNQPEAASFSDYVILVETGVKLDGTPRVVGHPLQTPTIANVLSLLWHDVLETA
jgi:hypothetical protein